MWENLEGVLHGPAPSMQSSSITNSQTHVPPEDSTVLAALSVEVSLVYTHLSDSQLYFPKQSENDEADPIDSTIVDRVEDLLVNGPSRWVNHARVDALTGETFDSYEGYERQIPCTPTPSMDLRHSFSEGSESDFTNYTTAVSEFNVVQGEIRTSQCLLRLIALSKFID